MDQLKVPFLVIYGLEGLSLCGVLWCCFCWPKSLIFIGLKNWRGHSFPKPNVEKKFLFFVTDGPEGLSWCGVLWCCCCWTKSLIFIELENWRGHSFRKPNVKDWVDQLKVPLIVTYCPEGLSWCGVMWCCCCCLPRSLILIESKRRGSTELEIAIILSHRSESDLCSFVKYMRDEAKWC